MIENKEWQEVVDAPIGHILKDWFEDEIRCLIKKGRSSLFACVGIPKSHPLAGFNYDDLPLDVHGGLCFSRCVNDEGWPKDYYWYGWDYRHRDDITTRNNRYNHLNAKAWTVEMFEKEVKEFAHDFKQLALFAEKLVLKHKAFLMEEINDELVGYLHKQSNFHNKNLEHDAEGFEKGLGQGMLNAYNEVYAKILELYDKEVPFIDHTDSEFEELKHGL